MPLQLVSGMLNANTTDNQQDCISTGKLTNHATAAATTTSSTEIPKCDSLEIKFNNKKNMHSIKKNLELATMNIITNHFSI